LNRETINGKQAICLMVIYILDGSLLLPTAPRAGNDLWMSIILSLILSSLMVIFLYSPISKTYAGKDLYEIIEIGFGKFLGRIIILLYVFFFLQLASLTIRDFGEIFNLLILPNTPVVVLFLFFAIVIIWALKEGIEVLGRISEVFIVILMGFLVVFAIILSSHINLDNLKPVLYEGIKPVILGALDAFAFPFGEIFAFSVIAPSIRKDVSIRSIYLKGLLIGGGILLITETMSISILGMERYTSFYFPALAAARMAALGPLQRIELPGLTLTILAGFIKSSITILAACKGLSRIFNLKDYRFIVTPVTALGIILTIIQFDSVLELFNWSKYYWLYYSSLFLVVLPLIILILIKIRKKFNRGMGGLADE